MIPTHKWYYLIRCTCRIVTKEFVASPHKTKSDKLRKTRYIMKHIEGEDTVGDAIFIGVEKSMRKGKKNIGSKNGLEKACKSRDFTKKEECEVEKWSYSHPIGANLDSLER
ncbi:hypothetical protein PIB30_043383 [Stylosanthes scabra]|uniref:Uncharacterized protein n=1 Tax=Stylosanthes scabra TaxID=79078 RepID=A0ABU6ZEB2_9FABA|nr:hypothetical protein [Stylosanthes scabra]